MKNEEVEPRNTTTEISQRVVHLDDFLAATQAWESASLHHDGMLGQVILANTFEIPRMDIINLAEEIKNLGPDVVTSVRAYIGAEVYSEEDNLWEMKLYFTGVNDANLPILHNQSGGSAIYDFVTPCPPTCEGGGGISG